MRRSFALVRNTSIHARITGALREAEGPPPAGGGSFCPFEQQGLYQPIHSCLRSGCRYPEPKPRTDLCDREITKKKIFSIVDLKNKIYFLS